MAGISTDDFNALVLVAVSRPVDFRAWTKQARNGLA